MKTILPGFWAVLLLAGCAKTNDPAAANQPIAVTNTAIFGTWREVSELETRTYASGAPTTSTTRVFAPVTVTYTFTDRGQYRQVTTDTLNTNANGRFTYNDERLALYPDTGVLRADVVSLSAAELVLRIDEGGTEPNIVRTRTYTR